jgi:PncC family amidohydrolase|tara:strand:- start:607 stop:1092 length:486 start_codon:yes stop_codon:yes gene_type:complete
MNSILEKVKDLKNIALAKNQLISAAESCTGGLISKYLTDIPGSSSFFESSVITYSNESKISLLNVSPESLSEHGAVSEKVVEEMSRGILKISAATVAIAISGIMGPSSDNTSKKIGSTWLCIMSNSKTKTFFLELSKSRQENREEAAKIAIINLYDFINEL